MKNNVASGEKLKSGNVNPIFAFTEAEILSFASVCQFVDRCFWQDYEKSTGDSYTLKG